ncbi:DNA-binding response regulator [Hydrogenophaga crassostreae]|uniref:DNA-binding response regulator n=1 Tax=Hydrogenophaga crassostreae TaxID=1763535 RepID=A0A162SUA9_9BURK|nr:response regulator transcription factor [Hydrogenophaga crassostreae]AOW12529.1 DNA-binding response regulator [Hydrogenophaga crassostreae]OAD40397.1 DNA-binding response regulator [Hydrogenophaga crassostreae]
MSDIYLVDDHALMRDGLRAVLEDAGHRVVGESDQPTAALADLVRLQPAVLLLDIHLGQRLGFELLEQIQQRKLAVRTIMLTMSAQARHVADAMRLGAAGYVLKGSSADEVLRAIDAVQAGKRYLGQEAAQLAVQGLTESSTGEALASLSTREHQVLLMVVRGQTSAVIAEELHLSPKTVESYRSRLMAKLGVADVTGLVRLAIRERLISADER